MVANRTGIKWSREETILALDLYLKINFSKIGKDNVEIIRLANLIGRTPSSVAMKICNIASFDPLIKKGIYRDYQMLVSLMVLYLKNLVKI